MPLQKDVACTHAMPLPAACSFRYAWWLFSRCWLFRHLRCWYYVSPDIFAIFHWYHYWCRDVFFCRYLLPWCCRRCLFPVADYAISILFFFFFHFFFRYYFFAFRCLYVIISSFDYSRCRLWYFSSSLLFRHAFAIFFRRFAAIIWYHYYLPLYFHLFSPFSSFWWCFSIACFHIFFFFDAAVFLLIFMPPMILIFRCRLIILPDYISLIFRFAVFHYCLRLMPLSLSAIISLFHFLPSPMILMPFYFFFFFFFSLMPISFIIFLFWSSFSLFFHRRFFFDDFIIYFDYFADYWRRLLFSIADWCSFHFRRHWCFFCRFHFRYFRFSFFHAMPAFSMLMFCLSPLFHVLLIYFRWFCLMPFRYSSMLMLIYFIFATIFAADSMICRFLRCRWFSLFYASLFFFIFHALPWCHYFFFRHFDFHSSLLMPAWLFFDFRWWFVDDFPFHYFFFAFLIRYFDAYIIFAMISLFFHYCRHYYSAFFLLIFLPLFILFRFWLFSLFSLFFADIRHFSSRHIIIFSLFRYAAIIFAIHYFSLFSPSLRYLLLRHIYFDAIFDAIFRFHYFPPFPLIFIFIDWLLFLFFIFFSLSSLILMPIAAIILIAMPDFMPFHWCLYDFSLFFAFDYLLFRLFLRWYFAMLIRCWCFAFWYAIDADADAAITMLTLMLILMLMSFFFSPLPLFRHYYFLRHAYSFRYWCRWLFDIFTPLDADWCCCIFAFFSYAYFFFSLFFFFDAFHIFPWYFIFFAFRFRLYFSCWCWYSLILSLILPLISLFLRWCRWCCRAFISSPHAFHADFRLFSLMLLICFSPLLISILPLFWCLRLFAWYARYFFLRHWYSFIFLLMFHYFHFAFRFSPHADIFSFWCLIFRYSLPFRSWYAMPLMILMPFRCRWYFDYYWCPDAAILRYFAMLMPLIDIMLLFRCLFCHAMLILAALLRWCCCLCCWYADAAIIDATIFALFADDAIDAHAMIDAADTLICHFRFFFAMLMPSCFDFHFDTIDCRFDFADWFSFIISMPFLFHYFRRFFLLYLPFFFFSIFFADILITALMPDISPFAFFFFFFFFFRFSLLLFFIFIAAIIFIIFFFAADAIFIISLMLIHTLFATFMLATIIDIIFLLFFFVFPLIITPYFDIDFHYFPLIAFRFDTLFFHYAWCLLRFAFRLFRHWFSVFHATSLFFPLLMPFSPSLFLFADIFFLLIDFLAFASWCWLLFISIISPFWCRWYATPPFCWFYAVDDILMLPCIYFSPLMPPLSLHIDYFIVDIVIFWCHAFTFLPSLFFRFFMLPFLLRHYFDDALPSMPPLSISFCMMMLFFHYSPFHFRLPFSPAFDYFIIFCWFFFDYFDFDALFFIDALLFSDIAAAIDAAFRFFIADYADYADYFDYFIYCYSLCCRHVSLFFFHLFYADIIAWYWFYFDAIFASFLLIFRFRHAAIYYAMLRFSMPDFLFFFFFFDAFISSFAFDYIHWFYLFCLFRFSMMPDADDSIIYCWLFAFFFLLLLMLIFLFSFFAIIFIAYYFVAWLFFIISYPFHAAFFRFFLHFHYSSFIADIFAAFDADYYFDAAFWCFLLFAFADDAAFLRYLIFAAVDFFFFFFFFSPYAIFHYFRRRRFFSSLPFIIFFFDYAAFRRFHFAWCLSLLFRLHYYIALIRHFESLMPFLFIDFSTRCFDADWYFDAFFSPYAFAAYAIDAYAITRYLMPCSYSFSFLLLIFTAIYTLFAAHFIRLTLMPLRCFTLCHFADACHYFLLMLMLLIDFFFATDCFFACRWFWYFRLRAFLISPFFFRLLFRRHATPFFFFHFFAFAWFFFFFFFRLFFACLYFVAAYLPMLMMPPFFFAFDILSSPFHDTPFSPLLMLSIIDIRFIFICRRFHFSILFFMPDDCWLLRPLFRRLFAIFDCRHAHAIMPFSPLIRCWYALIIFAWYSLMLPLDILISPFFFDVTHTAWCCLPPPMIPACFAATSLLIAPCWCLMPFDISPLFDYAPLDIFRRCWYIFSPLFAIIRCWLLFFISWCRLISSFASAASFISLFWYYAFALIFRCFFRFDAFFFHYFIFFWCYHMLISLFSFFFWCRLFITPRWLIIAAADTTPLRWCRRRYSCRYFFIFHYFRCYHFFAAIIIIIILLSFFIIIISYYFIIFMLLRYFHFRYVYYSTLILFWYADRWYAIAFAAIISFFSADISLYVYFTLISMPYALLRRYLRFFFADFSPPCLSIISIWFCRYLIFFDADFDADAACHCFDIFHWCCWLFLLIIVILCCRWCCREFAAFSWSFDFLLIIYAIFVCHFDDIIAFDVRWYYADAFADMPPCLLDAWYFAMPYACMLPLMSRFYFDVSPVVSMLIRCRLMLACFFFFFCCFADYAAWYSFAVYACRFYATALIFCRFRFFMPLLMPYFFFFDIDARRHAFAIFRPPFSASIFIAAFFIAILMIFSIFSIIPFSLIYFIFRRLMLMILLFLHCWFFADFSIIFFRFACHADTPLSITPFFIAPFFWLFLLPRRHSFFFSLMMLIDAACLWFIIFLLSSMLSPPPIFYFSLFSFFLYFHFFRCFRLCFSLFRSAVFFFFFALMLFFFYAIILRYAFRWLFRHCLIFDADIFDADCCCFTPDDYAADAVFFLSIICLPICWCWCLFDISLWYYALLFHFSISPPPDAFFACHFSPLLIAAWLFRRLCWWLFSLWYHFRRCLFDIDADFAYFWCRWWLRHIFWFSAWFFMLMLAMPRSLMSCLFFILFFFADSFFITLIHYFIIFFIADFFFRFDYFLSFFHYCRPPLFAAFIFFPFIICLIFISSFYAFLRWLFICFFRWWFHACCRHFHWFSMLILLPFILFFLYWFSFSSLISPHFFFDFLFPLILSDSSSPFSFFLSIFRFAVDVRFFTFAADYAYFAASFDWCRHYYWCWFFFFLHFRLFFAADAARLMSLLISIPIFDAIHADAWCFLDYFLRCCCHYFSAFIRHFHWCFRCHFRRLISLLHFFRRCCRRLMPLSFTLLFSLFRFFSLSLIITDAFLILRWLILMPSFRYFLIITLRLCFHFDLFLISIISSFAHYAFHFLLIFRYAFFFHADFTFSLFCFFSDALPVISFFFDCRYTICWFFHFFDYFRCRLFDAIFSPFSLLFFSMLITIFFIIFFSMPFSPLFRFFACHYPWCCLFIIRCHTPPRHYAFIIFAPFRFFIYAVFRFFSSLILLFIFPSLSLCRLISLISPILIAILSAAFDAAYAFRFLFSFSFYISSIRFIFVALFTLAFIFFAAIRFVSIFVITILIFHFFFSLMLMIIFFAIFHYFYFAAIRAASYAFFMLDATLRRWYIAYDAIFAICLLLMPLPDAYFAIKMLIIIDMPLFAWCFSSILRVYTYADYYAILTTLRLRWYDAAVSSLAAHCFHVAAADRSYMPFLRLISFTWCCWCWYFFFHADVHAMLFFMPWYDADYFRRRLRLLLFRHAADFTPLVLIAIISIWLFIFFSRFCFAFAVISSFDYFFFRHDADFSDADTLLLRWCLMLMLMPDASLPWLFSPCTPLILMFTRYWCHFDASLLLPWFWCHIFFFFSWYDADADCWCRRYVSPYADCWYVFRLLFIDATLPIRYAHYFDTPADFRFDAMLRHFRFAYAFAITPPMFRWYYFDLSLFAFFCYASPFSMIFFFIRWYFRFLFFFFIIIFFFWLYFIIFRALLLFSFFFDIHYFFATISIALFFFLISHWYYFADIIFIDYILFSDFDVILLIISSLFHSSDFPFFD